MDFIVEFEEDVEKLAKRFVELIEERDRVPYHEHENNPRCREIDDVLIPQIISQVPDGMMNLFNQFVSFIIR
jgi:hypothetical protein